MTVSYLFDYASPWSYLANALLARRFPGATVDYQPIYLRGLELFSRGFPYTSHKLRYMGQDFLRCCKHEGVPSLFPANFPINGMQALRGALVAQAEGGFAEYHERMFAAAWRDNRDVSSKAVVLEVAREAGLSTERFAVALDDPAIKERLRTVTAAAEARGVFGVPTFFVGEEVFVGHDRMDYVARALAAGA